MPIHYQNPPLSISPIFSLLSPDGHLGAYLTFPISPLARINETVIENRVGVSFISIEQACYNLENEVLHKSFERIQSEGASEWEHALSAIQVHNPIGTVQKGYGTEEGQWDQLRIFYSSLYRTMLMPVDKTGENARWQSDEPYWDDFCKCLIYGMVLCHALYPLPMLWFLLTLGMGMRHMSHVHTRANGILTYYFIIFSRVSI